MKSISSRDNPLYKELKKLATNAQSRRAAGKALLEGVHLCQVYLQHQGHPAYCIVSESGLSHHEVVPIVAQSEAQGGQCIVLPDALYHAISQVEAGLGLLFVIDVPQHVLSNDADGLRQSAVLLDSLQDPGNLGSLLRSAAAAGIQYVFCNSGTVHAWSPKVLRAGMGAHFLLKIIENVDLATLAPTLDMPILATSSHATKNLYDMDLRQPVAWIFGHEGRGVASDLLVLASDQIAIPHLGNMESLNVAASAAVCFFEQVRQSRFSG